MVLSYTMIESWAIGPSHTRVSLGHARKPIDFSLPFTVGSIRGISRFCRRVGESVECNYNTPNRVLIPSFDL